MKNRTQRLLLCLILSAFCFTFNFSCSSSSKIIAGNGTLTSVDSIYKEDSLIKAMIVPYKQTADAEMNAVIGISDQVLRNAQPEGLLGDFAADILLLKAKEYCSGPSSMNQDIKSADLCVLSSNTFRTSLPKGNITLGNVFQLMPYDNVIVIVKMKGPDVKEILDYIAAKGGVPVAGMKMKIKNNMPDSVLIGDKPFDPLRDYIVVTTDYLANGGDNMTFYKNALKRTSTEIKLRDAITVYIKEEFKKGNTIHVKKDGRVQAAE